MDGREKEAKRKTALLNMVPLKGQTTTFVINFQMITGYKTVVRERRVRKTK